MLFITVLDEVSNERVAKIGRALAQLHPMDGTEACITTENKLAEQDVGYLFGGFSCQCVRRTLK